MTIEATRDLATRLIVSTVALAAFGLALKERTTGLQLDPAIKGEVDRSLARWKRNICEGVDQSALRPLLAELRGASSRRRAVPFAGVSRSPGSAHGNAFRPRCGS
jgi:hypothetical protein